MPLAMLIGLIVAVGRLYGPWWIRWPFEVYVEFLRGTPLLLQLFVIYYVLPQFTGIRIPEFWAGVLGLAINYSAYEAENYRAGLLAIPRGQMEAALSLGMSTPTAPAPSDRAAGGANRHSARHQRLHRPVQRHVRVLDDRRHGAHRHVPLPVPKPPAAHAGIRPHDGTLVSHDELPAIARRAANGNTVQESIRMTRPVNEKTHAEAQKSAELGTLIFTNLR